jgi:hypothetical protein
MRPNKDDRHTVTLGHVVNRQLGGPENRARRGNQNCPSRLAPLVYSGEPKIVFKLVEGEG